MSDITVKMARDLEADKVIVIGTKNGEGSDPIVVYSNKFKGKHYFHIRSVYQNDRDQWCPGKGLAVDPSQAKVLLKGLGLAADHI